MAVTVIVFFGVTTLLWSLTHVYAYRRLVGPLDLEGRGRRVAAGIALLLWSVGPVTMGAGRVLGRAAWFAPVRWVGFVYMGVFTLLLLGLLLRDLVALNGRAYAWWRRRRGDALVEDLERRRFLANATNAGMVGAVGALASWGFYEAVRAPEVVEVDVPLDHLPEELEGYRIAQISDIHVGPTIDGSFLRSVVATVNGLAPDLVAVTGDLVDGTVAELGREVAALAELRATDGVFFVTGNHEYYWDAEAWCAEVDRLGLTVLQNAHRLVERSGRRILVAGCTDYRAERILPAHASSPRRAREGAPAHDVSILLAHQPRSIHAASEAGYDLQLSGHTHGGQFFPVTLLVGLVHPFAEGLGRLARTWIYVNRGTGYWGPPLRAGSRSEITLLRLVRGREADGA